MARDQESMIPKQHATIRPEVTALVIRIKLGDRANDIYAVGFFGRAVARLYFIEFQKRGIPHAQIICTIEDEDAPKTTDDYDIIVSAVISEQYKEHALWHTVKTSMTHGPCGAINA